MLSRNIQSPKYVAFFAVTLCGVCSLLVSSAAVGLRDKQRINRQVDRQSKVLTVAGLTKPGEALSSGEIRKRYEGAISARVVELESGNYVDDIDPANFDQRRAARDPARSAIAPPNNAKVTRVPRNALVYHVLKDGEIEGLIVPISGYGLWSTMYGFVALGTDGKTIRGITFYEHGETPGLGGEVENPSWQAKWVDRKAFNPQGGVAIRVIKGTAGPPDDDPYQVDGISGATITGRGVSAAFEFWLGPNAYGPYIERFRSETQKRGKDVGEG